MGNKEIPYTQKVFCDLSEEEMEFIVNLSCLLRDGEISLHDMKKAFTAGAIMTMFS